LSDIRKGGKRVLFLGVIRGCSEVPMLRNNQGAKKDLGDVKSATKDKTLRISSVSRKILKEFEKNNKCITRR
jgi:hypothetical protein